MVIQVFSSSIVFLDTSPLIYFMEGQSKFQKILSRLFDLNEPGQSSNFQKYIFENVEKSASETEDHRC